jgi:hypothetical protein
MRSKMNARGIGGVREHIANPLRLEGMALADRRVASTLELLDPGVSGVDHVDVAVDIGRHIAGLRELPWFAPRSLCVKNLAARRELDHATLRRLRHEDAAISAYGNAVRRQPDGILS